MQKQNQNVFILVSYFVIQLVAIIILVLLSTFNPRLLSDQLLYIEYGAYVNLIVMFVAALYFIKTYAIYFKDQFIQFHSDSVRLFGYAILTFLAIYIATIFSTILLDNLGVTETSDNQAALNLVAQSSLPAKISLVIFTVILAPIIEEFVFRKAVFGLFGHYKAIVPILLSGLIFGFIHVINDPNILQIIPYFISGVVIASMFEYSDRNIFVVIIGHGLYNAVGVTFMLLPPEYFEVSELIHLFVK